MNRNTRQLTLLTKVDIKYRELYDKIRKRKYNRGPYKGMNADELELHITIESLAKELLKGLFREQIIDKPMTKCWEVPCCYRTRDICHPPLLDIRKIIKAQETDINTKKNILISNTSYQNILDNTTLINRYKLVDFVNEQILESSYINNKSKED